MTFTTTGHTEEVVFELPIGQKPDEIITGGYTEEELVEALGEDWRNLGHHAVKGDIHEAPSRDFTVIHGETSERYYTNQAGWDYFLTFRDTDKIGSSALMVSGENISLATNARIRIATDRKSPWSD